MFIVGKIISDGETNFSQKEEEKKFIQIKNI